MRQGLCKCGQCGTMRSAIYSAALEKPLCASCAVAMVDEMLLLNSIRADRERADMPVRRDQAEKLREMMKIRGIV